LQATSFEGAKTISGELFAEKYLLRRVSCAGCPIGCIHVAMLQHSFSKAYEYEALNISYNFELIYALGSNLGVADPEAVLELIEACEKAGVDVISMGVLSTLFLFYTKICNFHKSTFQLPAKMRL
jgi:aldehyde:ferredoxin oxidoreductase